MKANFLRHEGYLGAVGAFLSVHPMAGVPPPASPAAPAAAAAEREPRKVRPPRRCATTAGAACTAWVSAGRGAQLYPALSIQLYGEADGVRNRLTAAAR